MTAHNDKRHLRVLYQYSLNVNDPAVGAYFRSVRAADYLHTLLPGYSYSLFICKAEMDDRSPSSLWWMDGQWVLFLGGGK